jgi:transcriptional regulator with XRE-family HTH domain
MAMTNAQIGALIGVSESMASRLCSGERLPSPATMVLISRVFNVSADRLLVAHGQGGEIFGPMLVRLIDEYEKRPVE